MSLAIEVDLKAKGFKANQSEENDHNKSDANKDATTFPIQNLKSTLVSKDKVRILDIKLFRYFTHAYWFLIENNAING